MGPKKSRKDVGGSRRPNVALNYDDDKFINKLAQDEYEKLRARPIAKERGFDPCVTDGLLIRMINERGWGVFCQEPIEVPMGVVREFYANGKVEANGYTFVRGTILDYQPETIRALYELPPPADGVEDWCLRSHGDLDLDAVLAGLCVPGTDWKRRVGSNEPLSFLAKHMNRYARAWNLFICANLMPSTHPHEIPVERAILLWGILTDEYVDLGHLLHSSMVKYMRSGSSAMIPHATVAARLCSLVGITWSVQEQMQHPMGPITHTTIAQMEDWAGGRAQERGLGYIIGDPEAGAGEGEHAGEEQREEPMPSARQQRAAARGARVGRAGTSRARPVMTDAQYSRLTRRLTRRIDAVHTMTSRFAADLVDALDDIAQAQNVQANWPEFGAYGVYPPPDSSPEEGNDDDE